MNTTLVLALVLLAVGAAIVIPSLRMCSEWQRKVVLRLGRYVGVRGPGIFFLVPYMETSPFTVDMRVTTDRLQADQTLSKDGASLSVETLVYWRVIDAGRATVQVADYTAAVRGAAQGAIRDIIGRNDLPTILSHRHELDQQLTTVLDEQTEAWGVKVQSVQLLDIRVPEQLQEAMARMAEADRERQARLILGDSEVKVAEMFATAGEVYRAHPTALHLRGMNMLFETMRSGLASVIVVPASALESMNLGALGGLKALAATPAGEPSPNKTDRAPASEP
jgi:regulator of protease activity HflC (stomatin/prohibitin superfamily)